MSDYDWTIEITPPARAAISREIKAQWDTCAIPPLDTGGGENFRQAANPGLTRG